MVQLLRRIFEKNNKEKKKETSCATETQKLRARKEILFLLRGIRDGICAQCKRCGYSFPETNIVMEFSKLKKENILFIRCNKCGYGSVDPKITSNDIPICTFRSQFLTLSMLKYEDIESLDPERIKSDYESVYHSAIFYYGSLKNAFSFVSKNYKYEEIPDWKVKIRPLVGQFSVSLISKMSGVSEKKIQKFVNSLK